MAFEGIYLICISGQTTYSTAMKAYRFRVNISQEIKGHMLFVEMFFPLKTSEKTLPQALADFSGTSDRLRASDHMSDDTEQRLNKVSSRVTFFLV